MKIKRLFEVLFSIMILSETSFAQTSHFISGKVYSYEMLQSSDTTIFSCSYTTKKDSSMVCSGNNCYWQDKFIKDSTCLPIHLKNLKLKVEINYSYFNSHNGTAILKVPNIYRPGKLIYNYRIDSVFGDTVCHPGQNRIGVIFYGMYDSGGTITCVLRATDTIAKDACAAGIDFIPVFASVSNTYKKLNNNRSYVLPLKKDTYYQLNGRKMKNNFKGAKHLRQILLKIN